MNSLPAGSIELTWYGHGTWLLRYLDQTILIDPFLNNNPKSPVKVDQVHCDTILVTHGHFDHIEDCVAVAQKCNAQVICNYEIAGWLNQHGVNNTVGMNIGGSYSSEPFKVKMTPAVHSSSLPDGQYGGLAAGFLFTVGGKTVYFAGDTAAFSDMQYLAAGIDVAILPIGDLFTMGPEDSLQAIEWLKPKQVAAGHFDTWPPIEQNAKTWAESVTRQGISQPLVTNVGLPVVIK